MKYVFALVSRLMFALPGVGLAASDGASRPGDVVGPHGSMADVLPRSTLMAVEIRGLAERWSEIRSCRALADYQDRVLGSVGLQPADLPALAGNRAILALVALSSPPSAIPVAVLSPPDLEAAEAILDGLRAGTEDPPRWTWRRRRGALWVGPGSAGDWLERLARGEEETGLAAALPLDELDRRLPPGGLIRGWLNPLAICDLLRAAMPQTRSPVASLLESIVSTEMNVVRILGYRRELEADRVVTDAVAICDTNALPGELARIFDPNASAPPTPSASELPENLVLAESCRLESRAWLPWLRWVAAERPRGPLRNVNFWIDEFEGRTGRDLQSDLIGALGEHGWFLLLETGNGKSMQAVAVLEATDARRAEETLLDLRTWAIEQSWCRTLGIAVLQPRDFTLQGNDVHQVRLWTPLGELPGPSFLAVDGHLVVGLGERALRAGLKLAERGLPASAAAGDRDAAPPAQWSLLVRGRSLARFLDNLIDADEREGRLGQLVEAVISLLGDVDRMSVEGWFESDAIRIHGEILFAQTIEGSR